MAPESLVDKILLTIGRHEQTRVRGMISLRQIAEELGLSTAFVNEKLMELASRGLIGISSTEIGDYGTWLKPAGKELLSRQIDNRNEITQYNIGAIIQVLRGETIQASAITHHAELSQIINDPDELRKQINYLTDQLLNAVRSELNLEYFRTYADALENLSNQLQSERPDPNLIKKLLSTLSFLGDVEGTLELMTRVWPYISPLLIIASNILGKMN